MRNIRHNNSYRSSLTPLILAIFIAFLAIITSILTIVQNGFQSSTFIIPIILTISSLLIAIFSLGRNAIYTVTQEISPLFSFIKKSRLFAFFAILGRTVNVLVVLLILLMILGLGSLIFGYITHSLSLIVL